MALPIGRRCGTWMIGCVSRQLRDMMVEARGGPQGCFVINNTAWIFLTSTPCGERISGRPMGCRWSRTLWCLASRPRFSPVKDIGSLIRAFAAAVSQEPGIRLAIAAMASKSAGAAGCRLCPAGTWPLRLAHGYGLLLQRLGCEYTDLLSEAYPTPFEGARMHCATISTHVGAASAL